jgi:hypothetical protein
VIVYSKWEPAVLYIRDIYHGYRSKSRVINHPTVERHTEEKLKRKAAENRGVTSSHKRQKVFFWMMLKIDASCGGAV